MSTPGGFTYGGAPTPDGSPSQYGDFQGSQPYTPGGVQAAPDVTQRYGMTGLPGQGISSPIYPAHLQGCVPVSLGKRVGARLLDTLIISCIVAGFVGLLFAFKPGWFTGDSTMVVDLLSFVVSLPFTIYYLVTGWWPGSQLLGVRTVRYERPSAPGWKGLAKELLNALLLAVLMFPRLIVAFGTRDEIGRHAVDRVCSVIVIDVEAGRDPLST